MIYDKYLQEAKGGNFMQKNLEKYANLLEMDSIFKKTSYLL